LALRGGFRQQYESDAAFDDVFGLPDLGGITTEIRVIPAGIDG